MLKHEQLDRIRRTLLDNETSITRINDTLEVLNGVIVHVNFDKDDALVFRNMQREVAYNVTTWLQKVLGRAIFELSHGNAGNVWTTVRLCAWMMEGVVIVDPWSLALYGHRENIKALVDVLRIARRQKELSMPVQEACINVVDAIVCITDGRLENMRAFEEAEGLAHSVKLLKDKRLGQEMRIKVMELFYCYMQPERVEPGARHVPVTGKGFTAALEATTHDFVPATPHQERIVASRSTGVSKSLAEKRELLHQVMPNADALLKRFETMELAL